MRLVVYTYIQIDFKKRVLVGSKIIDKYVRGQTPV